jgi:hypothetical protein
LGLPYSVSVGIQPDRFGASLPIAEILNTTTDRVAITEVFVDTYQNAANTVVLGFGRPGATGTPSQSMVFQEEDLANTNPVFCTLVTDWSVLPTAPTVYNRRVSLNAAATTRGEARWFFDPGFIILPSMSAVIWCISASAAAGNVRGDVTVVIDG